VDITACTLWLVVSDESDGCMCLELPGSRASTGVWFSDSNIIENRQDNRTVHMAAEGGVDAVLEEQRLVHLAEALVLLRHEINAGVSIEASLINCQIKSCYMAADVNQVVKCHVTPDRPSVKRACRTVTDVREAR
jgi:hypothetical protein